MTAAGDVDRTASDIGRTTQATAEPAIALGRTVVRVRPLGVGTWAWGDRFFWGYGREYADADLEAAFRESLAAGITLFDTAELYSRGQSERLLGRFHRNLTGTTTSAVDGGVGGGGGVVATAGGVMARGTTAAGTTAAGAAQAAAVIATKFFPYPWRLRRGDLLRALRGSLERLSVPSVALYQVHWPYPPVRIETWAEALADAVESGLASAVGVSNYSVSQMRRAHEALAQRGIPLASNQVHYSLLHRRPERDGVRNACRELGVTLIAYSPLEMGLLTGKYGPDQPPPGLRGRRYRRPRLVALQPLLAELRAIGEAHAGKTPSQVALNWLLSKETVPIPGAKNVCQARENAGALGWRLAPAEVERLDRASEGPSP